jgi:hypothetical protein
LPGRGGERSKEFFSAGNGSVKNFPDKILQFLRIPGGEVAKFKGAVIFPGEIRETFHPDNIAGGLEPIQLVVEIIENLDFQPLTDFKFLRKAQQDSTFGDIEGVTKAAFCRPGDQIFRRKPKGDSWVSALFAQNRI